MSENLPSIDDFTEDNSKLPSVDDIIKEENLPSIEEFVVEEPTMRANDPGEQGGFGGGAGQEEEIEEEEEAEEEDLTEVLRLINDLRRDIPDIPEIKYYDEELKQLSEQVESIRESIPEIPEIKEYEGEVEAICEQIDLVREEIKDLPEVKYYDEQVTLIEDRIDSLQTEVTNLPEVKYYDTEIEAICEAIDKVRSEIPVFPKWVNEVNEVPDFTWIGKTFSVIDDDFIKVGDNIKNLKDKFDQDIDHLTEDLDAKDFEKKVEIDELKEHVEDTKEKIYKELKETAIRIWEHHDRFKDDDRKLKKFVLGKFEVLRQNVSEQVEEFNNKNSEAQNIITDSLREYFDSLKEEIGSLPEVKYYDKDVKGLRKDLSELNEKHNDNSVNITELYRIVEDLQELQNDLKEDLTDNPPTYTQVGAGDPLIPLDQKFATLKDLSEHYRLFVNRVQTQMASIGGGGAVDLQYLDDIAGITTNISAYDGMFLQVDLEQTGIDTGKKFKFATVATASTTFTTDSNDDIYTLQNVGIATTARVDYSLYVGKPKSGTATTDVVAYFDGDISVAGTIFKDNVKNVDSIGIITARDGIIVETQGVSVTAGIVTTPSLYVGIAGTVIHSSTTTSKVGIATTNPNCTLTVGPVGASGTTLFVHGDAKVSGMLTANEFTGTYFGDGGNLTGLPGQKDFWSENATGINTLGKVGIGTTNATNTLTVGAVGASGTSLFVHGDARIVGVLTVGSGSVTIDGSTNKVTVGTGITLNATTGEIFAPAMKSVGTTAAFYPPVVTTTQRNSMTVTQGAMVFNSTDGKLQVYNGSSWQTLPGMTLGLTVALDG